MPIRISCPACAASLSIRDEFAGRAVRCPKCAGVIPPSAQPVATVSEAESVAALPPLPPPPAPPPPVAVAPPPVPPAPEPLDLPPDEPAPPPKPPKSGSRPVPPPEPRPRDEVEDDRRRRRRDEDDESDRRRRDEDDEDARPRRKRRDEDDRDERGRRRDRDEDRPRRRRRDEDDDRPAYARGRGQSNTGVAVAVVGAVVLLVGGGALAWYLSSQSDKEADPTVAGTPLNRNKFEGLKVGTATRAQVEQELGKGRAATVDDLVKVFGTEAAPIDKWTPLVAKNRVLVWQGGPDAVLAAFHPDAEPGARLQMKEWRARGVSSFAGEAGDLAFLTKYPPPDKADDLTGPAVPATGAEIANAYATDPGAADARYKDKVVVVEGTLEDIELELDGTMHVRIVGAAEPGGVAPRVTVQPGEMSKVLNCSRLQTVKFKGRCAGLSGTVVAIKSGKLEGKPGPDPALFVGGTELVEAYTQDEQKADARYKDRFVIVSGAEVASKTADAVYLASRKSKGLKIRMALSPEFLKQFDGVPVGRAVKVRGVCTGKSGDEILLDRGWLVP